MKTQICTLVGLATVLAVSAAAQAHSILPEVPTITGPVAGNYTWTYKADQTVNSTTKTGDFFILYDVAGYVPGSANIITSSGVWTIDDTHTVTAPPAGVLLLYPDNPAITDLKITYTSATTITGTGASVITFSLKSNFNLGTNVNDWSYSDHDINGNVGSGQQSIIGPSVVAGSTPEPASLGLLGFGALGLLIRRRRA